MQAVSATPSGTQATDPRLIVKLWIGLAVLLAGIAFYAWVVDFFTLAGERTIYTADCADGNWTGQRCGGHLVAGPRYRYRALQIHGEVLFWVVGSTEPAGKLDKCQISNGRNWSCPAGAESARSITLQMILGKAAADPQNRTRPFHSVSKLEWLLLREGLDVTGGGTE